MGAFGLALLEIVAIDRHPVCDMRQAEHRLLARLREGVQSGGFHFDREDAAAAGLIDCRRGFPERRVRGPGGAAVGLMGNITPCATSAPSASANAAGGR